VSSGLTKSGSKKRLALLKLPIAIPLVITIRTNQTIHKLFFAVLTVTFATIAFPPQSHAQRTAGEPVLIDGDLNSVDWRALIGKSVTVTGDLVVVDTFDLARRGQVKVATSQIDPNDADPDATSFEGGSNVAQVTGAQKLNDKATIILDDGSRRVGDQRSIRKDGAGREEAVTGVRRAASVDAG